VRRTVIALGIALTSPVYADGPLDGDGAPSDAPIQPVLKKKSQATSKKAAKKKKRGRAQVPNFDVTQTNAWKYGEMTPDECAAEVKTRNLPFTPEATYGVLAGGRLTGPIDGVTFRTRLSDEQRATSTWEIADCRLVLALDDFADVLAAHDIVEVRHYSMHRAAPTSPGPRSGSPDKVFSQHFGALAIDAAIFTTKDGTKMDVNDDFFGRIGAKTCGPDAGPRRKTDKSLALRAILCETAAKRIFNVILTPNHNRAHRNHFHLDVTPGAKWFIVD
jgi:hypothetical protein